MCGGEGSRLETTEEKPLYEIGQQPMIDRVLAACAESCCEDVYAAVSPAVPDTRRHLEEESVSIIETPGEGYVPDLQYALNAVSEPIATIACDIPLIEADLLNRLIDPDEEGPLTVYVPVALKRELGVSVDITEPSNTRPLTPTGINVVASDGEERSRVTYDVRAAVNVNRPEDAEVAERLV